MTITCATSTPSPTPSPTATNTSSTPSPTPTTTATNISQNRAQILGTIACGGGSLLVNGDVSPGTNLWYTFSLSGICPVTVASPSTTINAYDQGSTLTINSSPANTITIPATVTLSYDIQVIGPGSFTLTIQA